MTTAIFSILTALFVFCLYLWHRYQEIKRLPPGPWGLPILGYLPWIDRNLYRVTKAMASKYGTISSVQLGQKLVVFFHSYDIAREALVKHGDVFAGRPDLFWLTHVNNSRGIVPTDGETWKIIRRYTISSLRDFGVGKLSIEGKIHEEIRHLLRRIDEQNGQPFNATPMIANAVCNIICSVIYGNRFEYTDPLFHTLVRSTNEGFGISQGAVLNWLPWLQYFPPFSKIKQRLTELSIPFYATTNAAISRAEENLDAGQTPSNFVEAFVRETRQEGIKSAILKEHCVSTINQLFAAGNETTTTVMDWGLLLLVLNPIVQEKMQREIDRVVGKDRLPSWEDRARLPFVEATTYEVLRLANIGPVGLPHRCTEDIEFHGYLIPKDAVVFSSHGSWFEEEHFPDPLAFAPERFINDDGKVDCKKPMAPFGLGKRECVGEALAKMELFTLLSAIVQKYTLLPAPGENLEYVEGERRASGWTTHPIPYKLIAVRRR